MGHLAAKPSPRSFAVRYLCCARSFPCLRLGLGSWWGKFQPTWTIAHLMAPLPEHMRAITPDTALSSQKLRQINTSSFRAGFRWSNQEHLARRISIQAPVACGCSAMAHFAMACRPGLKPWWPQARSRPPCLASPKFRNGTWGRRSDPAAKRKFFSISTSSTTNFSYRQS